MQPTLGVDERSDGLTNDLTPAQTRIDAEAVATEVENGDILIKSERNRLIVEERLLISSRERNASSKRKRWRTLGVASTMKTAVETALFARSNSPAMSPWSSKFMLQKAINGDNSSYVAPGTSIDSNKVTQENSLGDLGLKLSLRGGGLDGKGEADTPNPSNF